MNYLNYKDFEPKKPVISSTLGANLEFNEWLKSNNYKFIVDKDNLPWQLKIDVKEIPSYLESKQMIYFISYVLQSTLSYDILLRTKMYDPADSNDNRILSFIVDDIIPLIIKLHPQKAYTIQEVKNLITQKILWIKETLPKFDIKDKKRKQIALWMEKQLTFNKK